MSIVKKALLLLLTPLLLWSEGLRHKEIYLVQEKAEQPHFQGGLHERIYNALLSRNVSLVATDLAAEKESTELTYVVLYSQPSFLKAATIKKIDPKKRLLFLWEPPVSNPGLYQKEYLDLFKRCYTWNDDLVDNKKFFKFYAPVFQPMSDSLPSFNDRKLVTQISANTTSDHPQELYSAREEVIRFFEDQPNTPFEFYGSGWETKGYKTYRGVADDTIATLKNYRFSVCYENMCGVKGYITEKIFESFAAGTIPIYWGASNIDTYIPKNCFIDRRDFKDFDEIYQFIASMDESRYNDYLDNIRLFLASDRAKLFSSEMFETIFLEAIRFP